MSDAVQPPTAREAAERHAIQARLAANVAPSERDPWSELYEAAMRMATTTYRAGAAAAGRNDDAYTEEDVASREAASAFGRAFARLEIAYAGVRIGYCTACQGLRRMSEPQRWEDEIVEFGGPAMTSECLHCHSTIRVREATR